MFRYLFCALLGGAFFQTQAQQQFHSEIDTFFDPNLKPFYFNVASGDPHYNSVIIWTKVWRETLENISIQWEVATDTMMQNIVQAGESSADSNTAFTVKVQVQNLQPHTTYFYRFKFENTYSPIGRTKTTPQFDTDSLRFAVASCSNYEAGFFNVYKLVAERNDIDAIIHLGDYIYEYATGKYGDLHLPRKNIPATEILTLKDYRSRYAEYRLDKNLQEAHRLHPMISIWDDHEFANNTYKNGSGNHQENEGNWETRKANGKKAYFEWLPITDNAEESIIRKISYGNLAELYLLDERTEARDKQVERLTDSTINAQRLLGEAQKQWLTDGIASSTARWKIIANQVVFSELHLEKITKKYHYTSDIWNGYPAERNTILDFFYAHNLKNIIIITGDIHVSLAFDLVKKPLDKTSYSRSNSTNVIGAEFVAPSVTSAGLGERIKSKPLANLAGSLMRSYNPHMRYSDMASHGFLLLTLTKEKATGTWIYVNTIIKEKYKTLAPKSWSTLWNNNRLFKEYAK